MGCKGSVECHEARLRFRAKCRKVSSRARFHLFYASKYLVKHILGGSVGGVITVSQPVSPCRVSRGLENV